MLAATDDNVIAFRRGASADEIKAAYLACAIKVDPQRQGGSEAALDALQHCVASALEIELPPKPWRACNLVLHGRALHGREQTALVTYVEAARLLGENLFTVEVVGALLELGNNPYFAMSDTDVFSDVAAQHMVHKPIVAAKEAAEARLVEAIESQSATPQVFGGRCASSPPAALSLCLHCRRSSRRESRRRSPRLHCRGRRSPTSKTSPCLFSPRKDCLAGK